MLQKSYSQVIWRQPYCFSPKVTSCDLRQQAVVGSVLLENNTFELICLDLNSSSRGDVLNTPNFLSNSCAESHQSFPVHVHILGYEPWNNNADVWVSSGRAAISYYGLYLTTLLSHTPKKKKKLPAKSVHKWLLKEVSQAHLVWDTAPELLVNDWGLLISVALQEQCLLHLS